VFSRKIKVGPPLKVTKPRNIGCFESALPVNDGVKQWNHPRSSLIISTKT
jgi:hypothetical protein